MVIVRPRNPGAKATVAQRQAFADSLHYLPPELAAFADSNNWCTAAVPEFQDAQRFIQKEADIYGPIAQSLSNPELAVWEKASDFDAAFLNVAVIYVWPDRNLMGDPYKRLSLIPGINCVFLKHDTGGWSAKIVPAESFKCNTSSAALAAASAIEVAEENLGTPGGTIPPVTRFVQTQDGIAFLGVRCGPSWCDVGGKPSEVPPSVLASAASVPDPLKGSPQILVKGWFDEQRIAVDAAERTPPLTPSPNGSAIVPVPGLRRISFESFGSRPQLVAYAYLSDQLDSYANDFGFSKGWNKIEMVRKGTDWEAIITDAAGAQKHKPVSWTPHTIGQLVGSARWDWMDTDEYIWISCDIGCCLIDSGRGT